MIIRRISPLTYRTHSLDLKLTEEQYLDWALGDTAPEDAMPDLTPDEREFVIHGIHPDEWLSKDADAIKNKQLPNSIKS